VLPPQHKQVQAWVASRPPRRGGRGRVPPPAGGSGGSVPPSGKRSDAARSAAVRPAVRPPPRTSRQRVQPERARGVELGGSAADRPRTPRPRATPACWLVSKDDVAAAPPRRDGAATQIVPVTERTEAKYKNRTSSRLGPPPTPPSQPPRPQRATTVPPAGDPRATLGVCASGPRVFPPADASHWRHTERRRARRAGLAAPVAPAAAAWGHTAAISVGAASAQTHRSCRATPRRTRRRRRRTGVQESDENIRF